VIKSSSKNGEERDAGTSVKDRRFLWKRVFNRLLLYLIVILAVIFLFNTPAESAFFDHGLSNQTSSVTF